MIELVTMGNIIMEMELFIMDIGLIVFNSEFWNDSSKYSGKYKNGKKRNRDLYMARLNYVYRRMENK